MVGQEDAAVGGLHSIIRIFIRRNRTLHLKLSRFEDAARGGGRWCYTRQRPIMGDHSHSSIMLRARVKTMAESPPTLHAGAETKADSPRTLRARVKTIAESPPTLRAGAETKADSPRTLRASGETVAQSPHTLRAGGEIKPETSTSERKHKVHPNRDCVSAGLDFVAQVGWGPDPNPPIS